MGGLKGLVGLVGDRGRKEGREGSGRSNRSGDEEGILRILVNMFAAVSKSTVHLAVPFFYFVVGPLVGVSPSYSQEIGRRCNKVMERKTEKFTYMQILRIKPHRPPLQPILPMFHIPLAQIL